MTATLERTESRDQVASPMLTRRRSPRVSLALIAVFVAVASALGFVVWARNLGDRTEVLVTTRDVAAGSVVRRSDLAVARIAGTRDVRAVPASALDQVVGRIAAGPIPKGTLINPDAVSAAPVLAPDRAIVGVTVRAGEAPLGRLQPGLQLMVVRTPSAGATDGDASILAASARVQAVTRPEKGDTAAAALGDAQYVALEVPVAVAPDIAAAAANNRVRLVLVGPS